MLLLKQRNVCMSLCYIYSKPHQKIQKHCLHFSSCISITACYAPPRPSHKKLLMGPWQWHKKKKNKKTAGGCFLSMSIAASWGDHWSGTESVAAVSKSSPACLITRNQCSVDVTPSSAINWTAGLVKCTVTFPTTHSQTRGNKSKNYQPSCCSKGSRKWFSHHHSCTSEQTNEHKINLSCSYVCIPCLQQIILYYNTSITLISTCHFLFLCIFFGFVHF